jgi:hypothetical protein
MKANLIRTFIIFLIVSSVSQTYAQDAKWLGMWSGKLDVSATKLQNLKLFLKCGPMKTGNQLL